MAQDILLLFFLKTTAPKNPQAATSQKTIALRKLTKMTAEGEGEGEDEDEVLGRIVVRRQ